MTNEKINTNEVLDDSELEQVTGGATGYIYYMGDREHGGYIAVKTTYKLSKTEVLSFLERARVLNEHDLQDGVDGKFHVPERDAQMVINNMSARGYEFIDYDDLYYRTIKAY